jgi:hypothetical protein
MSVPAEKLTNGGNDDLLAILNDTSGEPSTRGQLIRNRLRSREVSNDSPSNSVVENPDTQTTQYQSFNVNPTRILPKFRNVPRNREVSFPALQEWEGCVVEVSGLNFTARLIDITSNSKVVEEEADFPIEDVSESERDLLRPGAIFRWSIGYQRSRGGTRKRVSQVVFRRLPQWTESELRENAAKAAVFGAQVRGDMESGDSSTEL